MVGKLKKTILVVPFLLLIGVSYWYYNELKNIKNSNFIIINKANMTLSQYSYKGELLHQFKVATGKNFGDKIKKGDCKTPEGVFAIEEVVDASTWTHDFKDDDLGTIAGAYGPYFIRLKVNGQKGIGIHGTHDNSSLGKRASEGCIRLNNKDLSALVMNINTNAVVVITPGVDDVAINSNPELPNNTDKVILAEKVIETKENPIKAGNKIVLKKK
ncbi:MAG: L,D-transpeptidase [Flavobacterium sp.]|nr:L,D-transpeptidase [Flavobacterium sp.]